MFQIINRPPFSHTKLTSGLIERRLVGFEETLGLEEETAVVMQAILGSPFDSSYILSNPSLSEPRQIVLAILDACRKGNINMITCFTDEMTTVTDNVLKPVVLEWMVLVAAAAGKKEVVEFLLETKVLPLNSSDPTIQLFDDNPLKFNALGCAMIFSHREVAQFLKDFGFHVGDLMLSSAHYDVLASATRARDPQIAKSAFMLYRYIWDWYPSKAEDWAVEIASKEVIGPLSHFPRVVKLLENCILDGERELVDIFLQNDVRPNFTHYSIKLQETIQVKWEGTLLWELFQVFKTEEEYYNSASDKPLVMAYTVD